jgi:hypothetical protein
MPPTEAKISPDTSQLACASQAYVQLAFSGGASSCTGSRASTESSGTFWAARRVKPPGATTLTLMPWGSPSSASDRAIIATAPTAPAKWKS